MKDDFKGGKATPGTEFQKARNVEAMDKFMYSFSPISDEAKAAYENNCRKFRLGADWAYKWLAERVQKNNQASIKLEIELIERNEALTKERNELREELLQMDHAYSEQNKALIKEAEAAEKCIKALVQMQQHGADNSDVGAATKALHEWKKARRNND